MRTDWTDGTANQREIITHASKRRCAVCDDIISGLQFGKPQQDRACCHSLSCQQVMDSRSRMTDSQFAFHLALHRRLHQDRRRQREREAKRAEEQAAQESLENQQLLASVRAQTAGLDDGPIALVVIPSGATGTSTLPADRIDSYARHLTKVIGEAFDGTALADGPVEAHRKPAERLQRAEQRFADNAALRDLSDQLCGMCRGGCCGWGADDAYVTSSTIRRYRLANPDMSADDVLAAYLAVLPHESIEHSCINHTSTGCALPREMRSDTCNGYYCESLMAFQTEHLSRTERLSVVAIQRAKANWLGTGPGDVNPIVDVAVIDAHGKRTIPRE